MPQLKVFMSETRSTSLSHGATESFPGGKGSRDQGTIYVVAASKAKAVEYGKASGTSFSPTGMRAASGTSVEALIASGELVGEGTVLAESFQGHFVSLYLATANVWRSLGKIAGMQLVSQARVDELAAAIDVVEQEVTGAVDGVDTYLQTVLAAAQVQLETLRRLLP